MYMKPRIAVPVYSNRCMRARFPSSYDLPRRTKGKKGDDEIKTKRKEIKKKNNKYKKKNNNNNNNNKNNNNNNNN